MKKRSPLITVGIALIGILVVSVGLILLGSKDTRAFPSADSYLPSGTAAFADLLRRSGYQVVVDHEAKPHLRAGDVVIAFDPSLSKASNAFASEEDIEALRNTKEVIAQFVIKGGTLISFGMSPDFGDTSRQLWTSQTTVVCADGTSASVNWDGAAGPSFYLDDSAHGSIATIWSGTNSRGAGADFVTVSATGKGVEASFADGVIATNRFIDREQNALVIADVVSRVAKRGQRIVFAEASFGNSSSPGLLATIGPWAIAAWLQLLFLGAVILYTLGKPFGYPDPERRQERGARDLMDAMADTLRRGRMTKLALKTVYEDTMRQLRRLARGRQMERPGTFDAMTDLERAMNRLEAASEIGAPETSAVKFIQDVERLAHESGTRR